MGIGIMPSGIATYRFKAGNIPLAVRYELDVPLAGIMFSRTTGNRTTKYFQEVTTITISFRQHLSACPISDR